MEKIARQYGKIRNDSEQLDQRLAALKNRYKAFQIDTGAGPEIAASRKEFVKQIDKV